MKTGLYLHMARHRGYVTTRPELMPFAAHGNELESTAQPANSAVFTPKSFLLAKISPPQQDHQTCYEADDASQHADYRPVPVVKVKRGNETAHTRQQIKVRQGFVYRLG
jgi:hypothetical protein